MSFRRLLLLAAAALCFGIRAGHAHDFWIEPSSFRPSPDSPIHARLWVGMHWKGDPLPRHDPWIRRFVLVGPDGETPMLGLEGSDPAGLARIPASGLFWIAYESNQNTLELEAPKFEQYLRDEGLDRILALRAERGESAKPGHELFYRCAKALLQAGGQGDAGFDRTLGLTLEILAEANPYGLAPGGSLPVRVLYESKPLEGALVMALNRAAPEEVLQIRSDAQGRAVFTLQRPGDWLVKAVHMIPAREGKSADWESFWASLTFQLGPPPAAAPEASPPAASASPPPGAEPPPSLSRPIFLFGGFPILLVLLIAHRRHKRRED
jgi:uncharacterized GH25 family protein